MTDLMDEVTNNVNVMAANINCYSQMRTIAVATVRLWLHAVSQTAVAKGDLEELGRSSA